MMKMVQKKMDDCNDEHETGNTNAKNTNAIQNVGLCELPVDALSNVLSWLLTDPLTLYVVSNTSKRLKTIIDELIIDEDHTRIPGSVLLLYATSAGQLNIIQWLSSYEQFNFDPVFKTPTNEYIMSDLENDEMIRCYMSSGFGYKPRDDPNNYDLKNRCSLISKMQNLASSNGHLHIIEWLHNKGHVWNTCVCALAAKNGHFDTLKWLHIKNYPWNKETCAMAASGGYFEILKYARNNKCPWAEMTCSNAALGGHLEILKWAIESGCPYSSESVFRSAIFGGHLEIFKYLISIERDWYKLTTFDASYYGHLHILKYAIDNGRSWGDCICENAVRSGNLEMFKYTLSLGCRVPEDAVHLAACYGRLEMFKYLISLGYAWNTKTFGAIIINECMNIFEYMRENGLLLRNNNWPERTCFYAVQRDQLDFLKYAIENGCPLDPKTCDYAVSSGHLHILKYAKEKGCPWTIDTSYAAAENGCFKIFKWVIDNGCPKHDNICLIAASKGHLHILEYAIKNGCILNEKVCANAALNGQLKSLKCLRNNGCPWNVETCINAVKKGHFAILKYAIENECPLNETVCRHIVNLSMLKRATEREILLDECEIAIAHAHQCKHSDILEYLLHVLTKTFAKT